MWPVFMVVACNQYARKCLKNSYGGIVVILIPAEKVNFRCLSEGKFQEYNL